MIRLFLFLILFGTSQPIGNSQNQLYYVVWNIGQGLWTTLITPIECIHFDMGGERFPLKKIRYHCEHKKNYAYLSHSDLDHINGLEKWKTVCLMNQFQDISIRKQKIMQGLQPCLTEPELKNEIEIIHHGNFSNQKMTSKKNQDTNFSSQVIYLKKWNILITGDSTIAAEKIWATHPLIQKTQTLILGHHGSRTSTSDLLLKQMPQLKYGIVSARKKKYGHPHLQVVEKLMNKKIILLETEKLGNLFFDLKNRYDESGRN